jgi:niacin transporter
MKALISIDYTNDFVAPNGKLTTGIPGQKIEGNLLKATKEFTETGDYVVYAIDRHDEGDTHHPETKLFPPHNIAGTDGRKLFGSLQQYYDQTKEKEKV